MSNSRFWALSVSSALFVALSFVVVQAWDGPSDAPPGNNISAPINVGSGLQTKAGDFWANAIGTDAGYCIGVDCITSWPANWQTFTLGGRDHVYFQNATDGHVAIGMEPQYSDTWVSLETAGHVFVDAVSGGVGPLHIGYFGMSRPSSGSALTLTLNQDNATGPVQVGATGQTHPFYIYGAGWIRDTLVIGGGVDANPTGGYDTLRIKGNARVGISGGDGCLNNSAGTSIAGTCSSDARLKRVTGDIDHVLGGIASLNLVSYHWNDTAAKVYGNDVTVANTGFIAQDVQRAFPELVSTDAHGYLQLDYARLGLYTTAAVKELKEQVDAQQREIDSLKAQIAEIKNGR